jgi:hypothetical protein
VARIGKPWFAGAVALAAVAILAPAGARANGAFPDAQAIMVPADRPDEILIGTNFGLLRSEDRGATWTWSCEQAATTNGRLYQLGPPPGRRLYAVAASRLAFSDDGACGWQTADGAIAATSVQDAFVDPTDGTRVLAIGFVAGDGGVAYTVFASSDGGATFDTVIYRGAPGELVLGAEIARVDPATVYLSLATPAGAPVVARSHDGGASWQKVDLSGALGAGQIRIVAVDPVDADKLYLRFIGATDETLVIVEGGGTELVSTLKFSRGTLSAFVRTAAGQILAGGAADAAPVLFRSDDGGATFAPLPGAPTLRALAERDGVVYAATDAMTDGIAEAISTDAGATWQRGLALADVAAIDACVASACQDDCATRAAAGQWPAAMCAAAPPAPGAPDAGTATSDPDGGAPDGAARGVDPLPVPTFPSGGCGCALPPAHAPHALAALAALLCAAVSAAGRRRPRARAARRSTRR